MIVPDYERLKQEAISTINRRTILERYIKSTRFNKIYSKIRAHLQGSGHATMETLLNLDFSLAHAPVNQEILYILEKKISLVQLEVNNTRYYISRCDYRENHVIDFAMTHRHQLEQSHLYQLAASLDSDVERMFTRLELLPANSVKSCDKDLLMSFLLTIQDNLSAPSDDTDIDSDTDTDTDLDTDLDTNDEDN
jgi:hypothetical protein